MSYNRTSWLKLTLTFLLGSYLFGCSNTKKSFNEDAELLKIDGSSTVYPITSEVVKMYEEQFSDLHVILSVSGTGGGFDKFIEKEISINNASRPITEKETKKCLKNEVRFRHFEVAYDGIAVVVNKENDWIDHLTVDELKFIWMDNGAIKWSEIRNEWPNEDIELYGPGDASGTHDYFDEVILGKEQKFRKDYKKSENDNLLVTGISNNKHSLGFFGLAYFERNKEKLKLVPIDNGKGPITPTLETIANRKYEPLGRPMFIYVNEEFCQKPIGQKFLKFYLENVGVASQEVGYVPLSAESYQHSLTKL